MTEIKLVLTDIDDTVAPHMRHEVSAAVKQSIIDVENSGVTVAAVTGRHYWAAKQTLNVLGISGPCVLDGGATIIDTRNDETIWRQWLNVEQTKQVIEAILAHSLAVMYGEDHDMIEASAVNATTIDQPAPHIFALIDASKEAELSQNLQSIESIDFHFLNGSHPTTHERNRAVQITHVEATKYHGVEALRKLLNIPIENTLAIGDGDNDIALFRSAATKIAMGNGTDSLKEKADYITGTVSEDGFAQAMAKFVLS